MLLLQETRTLWTNNVEGRCVEGPCSAAHNLSSSGPVCDGHASAQADWVLEPMAHLWRMADDIKRTGSHKPQWKPGCWVADFML